MPLGPGGKYDAEAERVLTETKAEGVVLIVFRGIRGSGVSVSQEWSVVTHGETLARELPTILRDLAERVEKDLKK